MQLAKSIKNLFSVVKFEHTLFALPFAYLGMIMGCNGIPDKKVFLLVTGCMITARTVAMGFNRIVDLEYDRANSRTRNRSLASGKITVFPVVFMVLFSMILFFTFCYHLNELTTYLSPIAIILICGYSYTKRFTVFCHFILGICLAIAPVGGYIAATGKIDLSVLWIGCGVMSWVAGFDIIYSILDYKFDRETGLKSIPALYGINRSLELSKLTHIFSICFFLAAGYYGNFSYIYYTGLIFATFFILREHRLADRKDPKSLNSAFFVSNVIVSFTIFIFGSIDILMKGFNGSFI